MSNVLRSCRLGACVWVLALASLSAQAQSGFDRVKQGERYRAWLTQFEADLQQYRQRLARGGAQSTDEVAAIFHRTLVPDSRAVRNVQQIFGTGEPDYSRGGEIIFVGAAPLLLGQLRRSLPAGAGGDYPEEAQSPFPPGLSVWYMHIDSSDAIDDRCFGPGVFDTYHLPPSGTFERKAYPFLVFEDRRPALRLGGISAEFVAVLQCVDQTQYQ